MGLISFQYCFFISAALILYYLIPKRFRFTVLFGASAIFMLLSSAPITVIYPVVSISIVFFAGKYIENESAKYRKTVYIVTIIIIVAILSSLKYIVGLWSTGKSILAVFGINISVPELQLLAPVGISFYTLQLFGYLTDIYRSVGSAERNPVKLALFTTYFPSISSGPILRYNQISDELFRGHDISYKNITYGLQRMLWGVFKKIVIAERMAVISGVILNDTQLYTGGWILIGLISVVLLVYTDFSGNMDFIIGVSECFGVKLPENFKQPFFSTTFQEFWQRWHITLGAWLRDYIMFPLLRSSSWQKLSRFLKKTIGKKAAKLIPVLLAVLIMWLINGIWHGGHLNFLVMVTWFWFALSMGQILEPLCAKLVTILRINTDNFFYVLYQRIRTVAVFSIGLLFFSEQSVAKVFTTIKNLFRFPAGIRIFGDNEFIFNTTRELFGGTEEIVAMVVSVILLFYVESKQNRKAEIRHWLAERNIAVRWLILYGLIFFIILFGVYGPGYNASDFIYAGF